MPGARGGHGLSALIVLGKAMLCFDLAGGARGKFRTVLAFQEERAGRSRFEAFGVEVLAARDAVNVLLVVVLVLLRLKVFAFALGESLFSLGHASSSPCAVVRFDARASLYYRPSISASSALAPA